MTHLYDIVDHDELLLALIEGYIREQSHPEFPNYRILNYTEKAQFERKWNRTIKVCRGLIYDSDTLEVLARPFQKIHNWDEPEAPTMLWDNPVYAWGNKYDGSLGIAYVRPDGELALATRGSFASDQAIKGTQMLGEEDRIRCRSWIEAGYTPLFEIVYPENRIVINYGEKEFLAPLGYIHVETGEYVNDEVDGVRTFRDLVTDLSRPNSEGWVVWLSSRSAVKIKQADYVELHRLVTGLSDKEVWRQLRAGTYAEFAMKLPDEFYAMVEEMRYSIEEEYETIEGQAWYWHWAVSAEVPDGTRKDAALWVQKNVPSQYRGLVFSLMDGKDINDSIWKMVEPKGA